MGKPGNVFVDNDLIVDDPSKATHVLMSQDNYTRLREDNERLRKALEFALEAPGEIRKVMTAHDLVIDDLDDQIQKLAFTIYTKLVSVSDEADRALGE